MAKKPAAQATGAQAVRWDLSDLYSDQSDPAINRDLAEADRRAEALGQTYRGHLGKLSANELLTIIKEYEAVYEIASKAASFAYLNWSTRTEDASAGALLQKVTEAGSRLSQKLLFVSLEWAQAPDRKASRLLDDPSLAHYRHWLEMMRRYRPYLLSEPEEKILTEKAVTGRAAWGRFFEEVVSGIRYSLDGEQVPEQVVLSKLYDPDRSLRRRAAEAMTAGLAAHSRTTTYIFNTILADKASDDRLRGYPTWLTERNLGNEVDDATVEALVQAITGRYDLVARYYRLKKKLLGLDEMLDYDRYAPLPADDRHYRWGQAREIVLAAYGAFHPRMAEIAQMFFDRRWIDAPIVPGKQGGAYSHPSVPSVHPYVLINFEGTANDVMTIAHELGHGVHQWLARQQGLLQAETPLTTAETASVFGEMLTFHSLISAESKPANRLAMLTRKIEDTLATVFRQISLNRFEHAIHTARREEGELTTDRLSALWLSSQRAMFGDSLTMRDEYGLWWSYIPHFIRYPGYVYAYAFGNLLVMALYARYQEMGPAFPDLYLKMLSAGGTDWPHKIMEPLGVDLKEPQFWNHGLQLIEAMVTDAEALAQSQGLASKSRRAGSSSGKRN